MLFEYFSFDFDFTGYIYIYFFFFFGKFMYNFMLVNYFKLSYSLHFQPIFFQWEAIPKLYWLFISKRVLIRLD